jgi:hypothetical protein
MNFAQSRTGIPLDTRIPNIVPKKFSPCAFDAFTTPGGPFALASGLNAVQTAREQQLGSALIWSATTCRRFSRCDLSQLVVNESITNVTRRRGASGQSGDRSPHSKIRHYQLLLDKVLYAPLEWLFRLSYT